MLTAPLCFVALGCKSLTPQEDILTGTILFPFVQQTDVIGRNPQAEKFVLKSSVGNTEYVIEIPDAARDYDLVVPLADIQSVASDSAAPETRPDLPPSSSTDKELISEFPVIQGRNPEDTALTDAAFGVGSSEGPTQSPSYSMKLAKITELYKQRQYEYALIEVNDLLSYYPNSPRLYKMKGTILVKLRNLELAVGAWIRAAELDPMDGRIKKAIASLERKIDANKRSAMVLDMRRAQGLSEGTPAAPGAPVPNQPANGIPTPRN
jgi:tetratricopeptide (TPR) repeat protein